MRLTVSKLRIYPVLPDKLKLSALRHTWTGFWALHVDIANLKNYSNLCKQFVYDL